MQVSQNNNNISFERLRIKIKGKQFKEFPEDAKRIKDAIKNDEGITDFFKTHNGKIEVTSSTTNVPVKYDYPYFLRNKPDFMEDSFTVDRDFDQIDIKCTYNRAFALRNLFRKPVWIDFRTQPEKNSTWQSCMNGALKLIKTLGKDTPEAMAGRGDTKLRDLFSVEARRLKVEKT